MAKVRAIFGVNSAKSSQEENSQNDKQQTERLEDLEAAVSLIAEQMADTSKQEDIKKISESLAQLVNDIKALNKQITSTPDSTHNPRPADTGAAKTILTDC